MALANRTTCAIQIQEFGRAEMPLALHCEQEISDPFQYQRRLVFQ